MQEQSMSGARLRFGFSGMTGGYHVQDIEKTVLLYYKPEKSDFDPRFSNRSVSGFFAWYSRLTLALKRLGFEVHLNDYEIAKANPRQPVGLVGHPHLLQDWRLPNPAVVGPSMYDHPKLNPNLFKDNPNIKFYLVTCE